MGILKSIKKVASKTVSDAKNVVNKYSNNIDFKLNSISKTYDDVVNKTPSEIHKEKLKKLYDDLLSARTIEETAPQTLNEAEKKYYTFKDGSYEQRMLAKYTKEASQMNNQMRTSYNKKMNEMMQSLSYYNSQRSYSKNINMVKLSVLRDILNKLEQIRTEVANKNTNDRKSYYVIKDQESIVAWIHFFNQSLFAFMILFVIHSYYSNAMNIMTFVVVCIILVFIFYLDIIVNLIRKIPTSFNIYTSWAYEQEPDHISIAWFIAGGAVLLFSLIKLQA
jgi:hypothetical protein